MYPYIDFFGLKLYTLGLGIVISIFFFLFLVFHYSKKNNLNFWKFFTRFPLLLFLGYFFGSYFYYLIEHFLIFPTSLNELKMIFSPYGYKFSFIGLSLGFFLFLFIFFRYLSLDSEIKKRVDVIFYSLALSFVPLGIFLLLGESFIGRPTESILGIKAFSENSILNQYGKVYPVGAFVSITGILSFLFIFLLHYLLRINGIGFLGFIVLIILLNFVFYFQEYPRHGVVEIIQISLDIKNFWSFLLIIVILFYSLLVSRFK